MADETVSQPDQQVAAKLDAGPPDDKGAPAEPEKKVEPMTGGDKVEEAAPEKAEPGA